MIGETVSHYKIVEKLGEGGNGIVYKAEDTKLKRTVALKFLRDEVLEGEEQKARFLREAQVEAALNHPNICTVYEIDEVEGRPFIAMECVEGKSIRQKVASSPLKLDEALDVATQAAQGLQAAHQKQVVHRDIKSANIMLTEQGQVKIMDFGLAHLGDRSLLTKTGSKLGTPAYMSPEQTLGKKVDLRSDIWSLGVVIYETVAGQLPFKGEVEAAVAYAIVNEEPEPLTGIRLGVPIELDRIVAKALAKSPDERYQHVDELMVDLKAVRKQLESGAPSRPSRKEGESKARDERTRVTASPGAAVARPAGDSAGVVTSEVVSGEAIPLLERIRRPKVAVAALVVIAAAAAGLTWFVQRNTRIRWARQEALPEIARLAELCRFSRNGRASAPR